MTLEDLRDGLAEEYVRRILQRMYEVRKEFDEPIMRISMTGDRSNPDYRLEAVYEDTRAQSTGSYRGKSHREIAVERDGEISWSNDHLTLDQVAGLLGQIRQRPPKP
jgi:hypothetical protein